MERVLIAGGGAAGLSVAAVLERRGIRARVLERAERIGGSWASRYPSLRLNTPRILSTMPVYRMPRRYGRWPTRDHMVEYLEEYARRLESEISLGVELRRVDRRDGGWVADTSAGEIEAENVVVATGHDMHPVLPEWPGRESFEGELLHSAQYREPERYRGRKVLVVAPGTSGSEIAFELVSGGTAEVLVAMRTPPYLTKREWPRGVTVNYLALTLDYLPVRVADRFGLLAQRVMFGDLTRYGLPPGRVGPQTLTSVLHKGGLFDEGFVAALKAGDLAIVPAVERFDGRDVVLADGSRVQPEVVIAATGYDSGLRTLVGHLGVLDERGFPLAVAERTHAEAPGLYFNGYHLTISGQLIHMRRDARRIARSIAARPSRVATSG